MVDASVVPEKKKKKAKKAVPEKKMKKAKKESKEKSRKKAKVEEEGKIMVSYYKQTAEI